MRSRWSGSASADSPRSWSTGETGFLVPFQDVDALAARSLEILASSELRERLSLAGRERALERFSVARCVAEHERIYREALAGR